MGVLDAVEGPRDLDRLSDQELGRLAREIRDVLVRTASRNGGHLGPNLGVVELTIALHRVFDSPWDKVLFDVGHQSYVHKLLTGRCAGFETLKRQGGISGYPNQAESEHDVIENSHASTALSYADGFAKAYRLRGEDRRVVAVVGDGALTGGMAWEALNNIASGRDRPVVIVVNDNGRSYTPTVGGVAEHLNALRSSRRYEQVLHSVKKAVPRAPFAGRRTYEALHGMKAGLKDVLAPQVLFEDLGLKYIGPIDGHSRIAVEQALRQAREFGGPVIVHCVTRKGSGYDRAELDEEDHWHQTKGFDLSTGVPKARDREWTDVFAEELLEVGRERSDVVAVTAAMTYPTGLNVFGEQFPDRLFDVGIAEQHAVTSAAGLAMGGLHPVVAIYSTFLNRAFDQVLLDVALHRCGVTFVLDRAGITGDDGPSHNGMWDLSILQVVPGLRVAVPRDGRRLRELFREAVAVGDGPTVLRFPKGAVEPDIPAIDAVGGVDVLARHGARDVLLVSAGAMAGTCLTAAELLAGQGVGVTVVDPRWVKPVQDAVVELAGSYRLVASVEDNGRTGGSGAALALALADAQVTTPLHVAGIPQLFPEQAKRSALLEQLGLGAEALSAAITKALAAFADGL